MANTLDKQNSQKKKMAAKAALAAAIGAVALWSISAKSCLPRRAHGW